MIGPLSGDEAVAVANYAKDASGQDVHHRHRGVAGSDAPDRSAELVPLPRRRRAVERRPRRDRLQRARLAERGDHRWTTTASAGRRAPASSPTSAPSAARSPSASSRRSARRTTRRSSSSCRRPDEVDGYFWVVGGTGTGAALKAFEQQYGTSTDQHAGNLFFAFLGDDEVVGPQVVGCLRRRLRHRAGPPDGAGACVRGGHDRRVSGAARSGRLRLRLLQCGLDDDPGPRASGGDLATLPTTCLRSSSPATRSSERVADSGGSSCSTKPPGGSGPVPAADRRGRGRQSGDCGRRHGAERRSDLRRPLHLRQPAPGRDQPPCEDVDLPWNNIRVVTDGVITEDLIERNELVATGAGRMLGAPFKDDRDSTRDTRPRPPRPSCASAA